MTMIFVDMDPSEKLEKALAHLSGRFIASLYAGNINRTHTLLFPVSWLRLSRISPLW